MNKEIPDGEKPPQKKLTKGEGITAIVVLVIFCLVAYQAITSVPKNDSTAPAPVVSQPTRHSDIDAYIDAQAIIEKTLKAPSTAKFPSSSHATVEHYATDGFKISSYVDSQNGFGAMIRSEWTVLFEYVDEKLNIYQIIVDGEEVYRKPGT